MIDLHCHILPGVDDGAGSMEETLAMARIARSDGIHTIVATPHTLNGSYTNPVSRIISLTTQVQEEINNAGIDIRILPGADVHMSADMVEKVREKEVCTLGDNGRYLLVEFPHQMVPPGSREELYQLRLDGIIPVITHPERNLAIQNRIEILIEFIEMGCLAQITAMSVTGEFGEDAMLSSHMMLERRMAHIIASDAHSPDYRTPVLSRAVETASEILGDRRVAEAMAVDTPEAVLAGESVDIPEILDARKRRWWQIF